MKKKIRILCVALMVLFVIFILAPFLMLLGPDRFRDYIHRELVYEVIVSKLTEGVKRDREKALILMDFVEAHVLPHPVGSRVIDKHPLNDLIRGMGSCDQMANTLITLARKANIKGRLIFLYGYDSVSHHSVCDLYIDGRFRIFDPFIGSVFVDKEDNMAGFRDMQNRGGEFSPMRNQKAMGALNRVEKIKSSYIEWNKLPKEKSADLDIFEDIYLRLYEPAYEPKFFRVNYKQDRKRFALSRIMDLYYNTLGDGFLILFQELYFKLDNTDPYTKARFKHLSFRYKDAISEYSVNIDAIEDKFLKTEEIFFMGQAFWDMGDYKKSILEYERLLKFRGFPDARRRRVILAYLIDACLRIREFEKTEFYRSQIEENIWL
ncbi:MAG: transglutaminase domain-containing protein [Candidatus Omnitrophica bacterium]|nr:transglutaminase domain-containing protein [Candidatus Omnitrophota bacterium]